MDWRPTATRAALLARAELLSRIREFFARAGVLEVDTPLLGHAGAADPAIETLQVVVPAGIRFLQTSPESAMKRLLASGSGDLYQICKAFRGEERGRLHRGEFTMLEWYRVGFDHLQLMDEVASVVALALPGRPIERVTVAGLAARLGLPDPHSSSTTALAAHAVSRGAVLSHQDQADRPLLLDFLLEELVRVGLGPGRAAFLHDFPVEQAAYARLSPGTPPVAERFELVVDGVELANGYHEVTDPAEQRARLVQETTVRARRGLPPPRQDERWLAALEAGLPPCAGVALGVDRLLMLSLGVPDLGQVMAFGEDLV